MSNEINAVKEYLQDMLGFSAALRPWPEAAFLPRYLSAGREFFLLDIAGEECLLIKTKAASFRLSAFRKQLSKLPDGAPENIVLCFDALSAHQRKALIECGLSFLVPGSQLYLPFLGAMLQERTKPLRTAPERLSPTGQFLLLHYIYNMCSKSATKAQIAKVTKLSPMNVTRAVQELSLLGLLTVERAGRCDRVTPAAVGYLLYQRAKPFLIDPVQKRMSIKWTSALTNFPFAGESAGTLELTLYILGLIRLMFPKVLLPATTALGTIHPKGRELGILAGANVVMPNLSPTEVRKDYLLYDNKICTGDESAQCRHCLEMRMKSIGYQVVTDRGDSLNI